MPIPRASNPYVLAVVVLSITSVVAVVAITLIRPTQDNTGLIAAILGITVPTVTAFIGVAVRDIKAQVSELKIAVDGRLSQLLALTAKASHAEGKVDEKAEVAAGKLPPA